MTVNAPVNIALIKYWGKSQRHPVRPSTPSISLTLKGLDTTTTLTPADEFSFTLNGDTPSAASLERLREFTRQYTPALNVHVDSVNAGPTAAGIASSASGYAALSLGLKTMFDPELDWDAFVEKTANGSGSAARSLLGGAVLWDEDGTIKPVDFNHAEYQMAILLLSRLPKPISSREKMAASVKLPEFARWQDRNRLRSTRMIKAMAQGDFSTIGTLMEASTLDMHALTALDASSPPYLTKASIHIWNAVRAARAKGLAMYVTADAGPNIKVLFKKADHDRVVPFLQTFTHPVLVHNIADEGAHVCT
jgi:diphosphomevalonate decarboxylase